MTEPTKKARTEAKRAQQPQVTKRRAQSRRVRAHEAPLGSLTFEMFEATDGGRRSLVTSEEDD